MTKEEAVRFLDGLGYDVELTDRWLTPLTTRKLSDIYSFGGLEEVAKGGSQASRGYPTP